MSYFESPVWLRSCFILACLGAGAARGQTIALTEPLAAVQGIGPNGEGHDQAIAAWRILSRAPTSQLPTLLEAIPKDDPLAANWIRAAIDAIAERSVQAGEGLPIESLEAFLNRSDVAPRSRRLAFEWIERVDPHARQRLIPMMLNDSSIEMRRDAVESVLAEAKKQLEAGNKPAAVAAYRRALTAARDVDQIDDAFKQLAELGESIDLPRHFGFIIQWKLIGPFDNTNKGGFDVAYPPETEFLPDSSYEGKNGRVHWIDHQTEDKYGMVDLNEAIGKSMGAAAYAYAIFQSDKDQDAELRLGCINANKVWLNGELLTSNEVYHALTAIDQYVSRARLKAGPNQILVKVCQNEQTESWAQDWQFQLRVCDSVGTAVLPVK